MIVAICLMIAAVLFYLTIRWAYSVGFGTREYHKDVDRKIPEIEQCKTHKKEIEDSIEEILSEPCERISIMSKDGLQLSARYFSWDEAAMKSDEIVSDDVTTAKSLPESLVIIGFHGYRSTPVQDCAPIFHIAKSCRCRLILVDQRTHGSSDGETIAMGIKERHDCQLWTEYVQKRFGEQTQIILAGFSMGAATVLLATGLGLSKLVKGVIADCGYSDVKDILVQVGSKMKFLFGIQIHGKYLYPLVKLGAKVIGKFDPEEASPKEVLKTCQIPVLFIHGGKDRLVPVEMGYENYEACASEKELLIVEEADHCMSYWMDQKLYREKVMSFLEKNTK